MSFPSKVPFARFVDSVKMKTRGKYKKGFYEGLVWHHTAGRPGGTRTPQGRPKNNFAFLVNADDGIIYQAHDIREWGYHAGESALKNAALKLTLSGTVSDELMGVETTSAGKLDEYDGKYYAWWDMNGKKPKQGASPVPSSKVRVIEKNTENILKGAYMKFTDKQIQNFTDLCFWSKDVAPDIFMFKYVRGHDEVAGPLGIGYWRKNDPGGCIPGTMNQYRSYLEMYYPFYQKGWKYPSFEEFCKGVTSHDLPKESTKPAPVEQPKETLSVRKNNVLMIMDSLGYHDEGVRLIDFWSKKFPNGNPRYWAFADYSMPDTKPRFFLIDAQDSSVKSYLCSHGKGSDENNDDIADKFSNTPDSKMTSLGIFRCEETYNGSNGYSLRMDGLESTNSNARKRAIVIHGASYVSDEKKVAGRSWGCPALDNRIAKGVIDKLKGGSPFFAFKG